MEDSSHSGLAEFGPISPEEQSSNNGSFLSRLFRRAIGGSPSSSNVPPDSASIHSTQSDASVRENSSDASTITTPLDDQDRSVTNILTRIKKLIDTSGSYKDADLKQHWLPDSGSRECFECGDKFTTFRRRHHCRLCGQIFCSRCSNHMIPGRILGYNRGELRVCTYCCNIVITYLQANNLIGDDADLKSIQSLMSPTQLNRISQNQNDPPESENTSFPNNQRRSNLRRRQSMGFQEEKFLSRTRYQSENFDRENYNEQIDLERRLLLRDFEELLKLWSEIVSSPRKIVLGSHRHRLKLFQNCCVGQDVVQWLMNNEKASSRQSAVAIGQALIDCGFLICLSQIDQVFMDDYILYRPVSNTNQRSPSLSEEQEMPYSEAVTELVEPSLSSSSSIYGVDLHPEDSSAVLRKPQKNVAGTDQEVQPTSVSAALSASAMSMASHSVIQTSRDSNNAIEQVMEALKSEEKLNLPSSSSENQGSVSCCKTQALERLDYLWTQCEYGLVTQLLQSAGLSINTWRDVILPIVHTVNAVIRPDVKNDLDEMDIKQYVQFKKIPGGSTNECQIVNGVVCTKNVLSRSMKCQFTNPQILLLNSNIDYDRGTGPKLLDLQNVRLQEADYLKNVVTKLSSYKPNIILVQKNVAYLAREYLIENDITVAVDVKASVLFRVGRCTQAAIVSATDAHLTRPTLGMCHNFYTKSYDIPGEVKPKTLMFFDGCATHLGCTVILRGGPNEELKLVKQIMYFMLTAAYNWRRERSFLIEEFAMLPTLPSQNFDFDREQTSNQINNNETVKPEAISQLPDDQLKQGDEYMDEVTKNILDQMAEQENIENKNLIVEKKEDLHDESESIAFSENAENISVKMSDDQSNDINRPRVLIEDIDGNENSYLAIPQSQKSKSIDTTLEKISTEAVKDFSDPLHQHLNSESSSVTDKFLDTSPIEVEVREFRTQFQKAFEDVILTYSPCIKYTLPYLESDKGLNCPLRRFFDKDLYPSALLESQIPVRKRFLTQEKDPVQNSLIEVKAKHQLLTMNISNNIKEEKLQEIIADFRARGGSLRNVCHTCESHRTSQTNFSKEEGQNDPVARKPQMINGSYLTSSGKSDSLHPFNHQKICILYSSYPGLANQESFCVDPLIIPMDYYGCNDIPLGKFLEKYCFNPLYECPRKSCITEASHHVRKFVHESGSIEIFLRRLSEDDSVPPSSSIRMWNWCCHCKTVTPVVTMSLDTWNLSFAKYLEIRFYGNDLFRQDQSCNHSLHCDHWQYFWYKRELAIVKYTPIALREIAIPPPILQFSPNCFTQAVIVDIISKIANVGQSIFTLILKKIQAMIAECGPRWEVTMRPISRSFEELQSHFLDLITSAQLKATSPTLRDLINDPKTADVVQETFLKVFDQVILAKRVIAQGTSDWNAKTQELLQLKKKEEKYEKGKASGNATPLSRQQSGSSVPVQSQPIVSHGQVETGANVYNVMDSTSIGTLPTISQLSDPSVKFFGDIPPPALNSEEITEFDFDYNQGAFDSDARDVLATIETESRKNVSECSLCSRDVECKVHQVSSCGVIHRRQASDSASGITGSADRGHERSLSDGCSSSGGAEKDTTDSKLMQGSSKFMFSAPEFLNVKCPFKDSEIYSLLPEMTIPVVIYLDEPSSLIAHTLASKDYSNQLVNLQNRLLNIYNTLNQTNFAQTTFLENDSVLTIGTGERSDAGNINVSEVERKTKHLHVEVSGTDQRNAFHCLVVHAEHFRRLRKKVFPYGEEAYIRSLSRCIVWDAKGGKSGSTFCKTKDDRLVLKELSRYEWCSILEGGPAYVKYIIEREKEQQPSVLVRILGVYRINFHNVKYEFLVMENLFYNRKIIHKFDLKGSMMNRFVKSSNEKEESELVLLDENLCKMLISNPLYVRPHCKQVLQRAISRDTDFLIDQGVMDYSLLAGVDQEANEIVVGIIDYIRTFTWDKKMETFLKSNILAAGTGKTPTVISPKLYADRFIKAMDRYFLISPDRWSGHEASGKGHGVQ